jgi:hypothetical protein
MTMTKDELIKKWEKELDFTNKSLDYAEKNESIETYEFWIHKRNQLTSFINDLKQLTPFNEICDHQLTVETYILNQKCVICLHCDRVIKKVKN